MLTSPSGESRRISPGRSAPLGELGFHTLQQDDATRAVACSARADHESLLNNQDVASRAAGIGGAHSPRYLLTIAALLLLVVEGALYHRRRVG